MEDLKTETLTCQFCERLFEHQSGPIYYHQDRNFCIPCIFMMKHYPEKFLWQVIRRLRVLEERVEKLRAKNE